MKTMGQFHFNQVKDNITSVQPDSFCDNSNRSFVYFVRSQFLKRNF